MVATSAPSWLSRRSSSQPLAESGRICLKAHGVEGNRMEVPEGHLHDSVVETPDQNGAQQQRINSVIFAVRHAHTLTCRCVCGGGPRSASAIARSLKNIERR